jgi:hypothetical protein
MQDDYNDILGSLLLCGSDGKLSQITRYEFPTSLERVLAIGPLCLAVEMLWSSIHSIVLFRLLIVHELDHSYRFLQSPGFF